MGKRKIQVEGVEIRLFLEGEEDYISLTDIAKKFGDSRQIIRNWMRNTSTLNYLGLWEKLNNQDFKEAELGLFKNEITDNPSTFTMSPQKWISHTNACGLISKSGRGGGTYAHNDITLNFCYWIDPLFQLYFIREFQRLKSDEAAALNQPWNVNRYLSKINYYIHNDAVKSDVVPLLDQNTKRQNVFFAIEANRLNEIVFGMTAKQWQAMNPDKKGNMRDHATTIELQVLANIEVLNAELIKIGMSPDERMAILKNAAERHTNIIEEREQKKLE